MDYCCNQCGSGFEELNQLKEHKKSNHKGQTFNGFKTVRGSANSISKGGAIENLASLHTANSNSGSKSRNNSSSSRNNSSSRFNNSSSSRSNSSSSRARLALGDTIVVSWPGVHVISSSQVWGSSRLGYKSRIRTHIRKNVTFS